MIKQLEFGKAIKCQKKIKYVLFLIALIRCLGLTGQVNSPGSDLTQVMGKSGYELVKDWPQLPVGYIVGNPTGIGLDNKQNVFIFIRAGRSWKDVMPDSVISAKTILMLDRNTGKILNSWGAGLFIMPHGLTVDKQNNIWVTDVGLHQIFKFDQNGKLLMKLGVAKVAGNDSLHFNQPTDVAVADDGSFFVSDGYGNNRIVKFSSSGKYLLDWGSKGNKPGEFDLPHAVDLDSEGSLYVADRENNRIQKFDANGRFIKEWTNGGFAKMYSLTIDKKKNQMVAIDYLKVNSIIKGSNVIVFDKAHNNIRQFGRSGAYNGPLCRYHDISVDDEGNLYICDILGNSVQKFKKIDR